MIEISKAGRRAAWWLVFAALSSVAGPGALAQAAAAATLDGTLETIVEDHPDRGRTRHFLKTDKGRVELRFAKRAPVLNSGTRLRVSGELSGNVLALTDSGSSNLTVTAAAPLTSTLGEQKVAVLLVNFQDDTSQPYTVAQANDVVFNQVSGFMLENSFNKTWLSGNVFGWLTLPIAKTCLTSEIANAAQQAAIAAGINLSDYSRWVYVFPRNDVCVWSGAGTVGGSTSQSWINGRLQLKTVSHELGHNLGLQHSHALDCDSSALGASCVAQDYGDVADTMGSTAAGHFNAFQKERLGWLNGASGQPPITTAASTGSYTIGAFESNTPAPKALKVLKSSDPVTGTKTWYYIEYRQPIGFDAPLASLYGSNLVNGLLIRTGTDGDWSSSYLLDMTAGTIPTFDMGDAALVLGRVFTDSAAGVMINLEGSDAAGATVRVTLSSTTSACQRANPGVSISTGGAAAVAGTLVNYNVNVTNNDGSGCGSSAFTAQASLPAGWSGGFTSSSLTLAPGASASTTLSVTSASGAAAGTYPIGVGVANSQSPANIGSGASSYLIGGSLYTTVATNKSAYLRNETVRMSASLKSGGSPLPNIAVQFTLTRANGTSANFGATTDANGVANASYRVSRKDSAGLWTLRGSASVSGTATSATSGFTVQ